MTVEWRPISTMPRDGTFVLARQGCLMDVLNRPQGHAFGKWVRDPRSTPGFEWNGAIESFIKPTHWTHLPSP